MEQSNLGVQESKATKIHNALIYLKDTVQAVRRLEQRIRGDIDEAGNAGNDSVKTPIPPLADLLETTAPTLYERCEAINHSIEEIKKMLF